MKVYLVKSGDTLDMDTLTGSHLALDFRGHPDQAFVLKDHVYGHSGVCTCKEAKELILAYIEGVN